jgi:hypothetical protein
MCFRPRPTAAPRVFLQTVGTFGRWDCINAYQREGAKKSRFAACPSLLTSLATPRTAAKVRGFSHKASGFTAETDWLLEEAGFELLVPLPSCSCAEPYMAGVNA